MGKNKTKYCTCEVCGEGFYTKSHSKVKYCSDYCRKSVHNERRVCKYCEKEFWFKKSEKRNKKGIYCSLECFNSSRTQKITVTCNNCSKIFDKHQCKVDRSDNHFCSQECYFEYINSSITVKCNGCSKSFEIKKYDLNGRLNSGSKNVYCTKECYHKYYKGDKVYNYDPNTDEVLRIRKSRNYIDWRNKIFERDNYTCQSCGKIGYILNAHHIDGFSNNPDLRLDINNGITLCKDCHRQYHTIYGVKDVNSIDFYNWLDLKGENNNE